MNFPRCSHEKEYLGVSIKQFRGSVPPVRYKRFQIPGSLAKRGVGISESSASRLTPVMFPVLRCLNPQEDDAKFFGFTKNAEDGPSRASRFSKKRVLRNRLSSVHHAARKNRGSSFLEDTQYLQVDSERRTLQNCSSFQGHANSLASLNEFTLSCKS